MLLSSYARTATVGPEAESGTLSGVQHTNDDTASGGAQVVQDTTASAGTAIQFTANTPGFGANLHALWSDYSDATNKAIIDKLAAANIKWVRIDIGWDSIFYTGPNNIETWAVDKIDSTVNYAASKGIKVLGVWYYTPGWANGNKDHTYCPTDPDTYATSIDWASNHWANRIQAWEIWNEPDPAQSFWKCSQAEYVALLKAAYPAVHRGSPSALVVAGAPSSNDDDWYNQLYQLGVKGYFDILATHPYNGIADLPPDTPDTDKYTMTHVTSVRQVQISHSDVKPIWYTEFGWSSHSNTGTEQAWQKGVTLQQQADYAVNTIKWVQQNAPYVTNMFWYEARNENMGNILQDNFGLLTVDLQPKPVYTALQHYLSTVK